MSIKIKRHPRPSPPVLQWDGYSLKGEDRSSNEDRFEGAPFQHGAFLIVADGMGGPPAGEVASQLATCSMLRSLEHFDPHSTRRRLENGLRRAVTQAHRDIVADEQTHHVREGMGTTLTAALIHKSSVTVVHVGDSRCYLFRQGVLTPLTLDHTLGQVLRETGVRRAEADLSDHVLWNYLGGRDNSPAPFISTSRLERGDMLFLATDGLTNVIPDADLADVLSWGGEPKSVCRRLVGMARGRGSGDDATALLVRVA